MPEPHLRLLDECAVCEMSLSVTALPAALDDIFSEPERTIFCILRLTFSFPLKVRDLPW